MPDFSAAWSKAQIKPICDTSRSCVAHMPAVCVVQRRSLAHANHEQLDNTTKILAHTLCMLCKYASSGYDVNTVISECGDLGFGLGIVVLLAWLHCLYSQIRAGVLSRRIYYACTDLASCLLYLLLLCTNSELRHISWTEACPVLLQAG